MVVDDTAHRAHVTRAAMAAGCSAGVIVPRQCPPRDVPIDLPEGSAEQHRSTPPPREQQQQLLPHWNVKRTVFEALSFRLHSHCDGSACAHLGAYSQQGQHVGHYSRTSSAPLLQRRSARQRISRILMPTSTISNVRSATGASWSSLFPTAPEPEPICSRPGVVQPILLAAVRHHLSCCCSRAGVLLSALLAFAGTCPPAIVLLHVPLLLFHRLLWGSCITTTMSPRTRPARFQIH